MKKIIPIFLFALLVTVLALNEKIAEKKKDFITDINQQNVKGIENSCKNYGCNQKYLISVKLNPNSKYLDVEEEIIWVNNTSYPTDEIYFHLYANAYKSNNTFYAEEHDLHGDKFTHFEIQSLLIDDLFTSLQYQQYGEGVKDSTVAKVNIGKLLAEGDSIKINLSYKLKIPQSSNGVGYATGRNFFFISDWFPKIAVYENGNWHCAPVYASQRYYKEYAAYTVNIDVPNNYKLGASGRGKEFDIDDEWKRFSFEAENVNDFSWFAADDITHDQQLHLQENGTSIRIDGFVQPEREGYMPRYYAAIKNALEYFEKHIGPYPYKYLTFVDVPRTIKEHNIFRSTLLTLRADLFSPSDAKDLELQTISGLANLYFNNVFSADEVDNAWLGTGMAKYFTEKIMTEYYEPRNISFRVAKYFPIYGLNFLSHYEIPIIYTLGIYKYKEDTESLTNYLANRFIGSISDATYLLPNIKNVEVNSTYKPQLMLLSLERYVGYKKLLNIFTRYYKKYKFNHPSSNDFIELCKKYSGENMDWFFENLYSIPFGCDYSIDYVKPLTNNRYEVFVKKQGTGYFKTCIALYTENDTLTCNWDGKENWKKAIFKTDDIVIGAEVDPGNNNVMDSNYANNSFVIDERYSASISLAVRVFFWIQNALIIFGAIG